MKHDWDYDMVDRDLCRDETQTYAVGDLVRIVPARYQAVSIENIRKRKIILDHRDSEAYVSLPGNHDEGILGVVVGIQKSKQTKYAVMVMHAGRQVIVLTNILRIWGL